MEELIKEKRVVELEISVKFISVGFDKLEMENWSIKRYTDKLIQFLLKLTNKYKY